MDLLLLTIEFQMKPQIKSYMLASHNTSAQNSAVLDKIIAFRVAAKIPFSLCHVHSTVLFTVHQLLMFLISAFKFNNIYFLTWIKTLICDFELRGDFSQTAHE